MMLKKNRDAAKNRGLGRVILEKVFFLLEAPKKAGFFREHDHRYRRERRRRRRGHTLDGRTRQFNGRVGRRNSAIGAKTRSGVKQARRFQFAGASKLEDSVMSLTLPIEGIHGAGDPVPPKKRRHGCFRAPFSQVVRA